MDILVKNLSKQYHYQWIIKNFSHHFQSSHSYSIIGHNGSGKSTLMQLLAGFLTPTEGTVHYKKHASIITSKSFFQWHTLVAPYIELLEELTLQELLQFHFQFKQPISNMNVATMCTLLNLEKESNQYIKYLSSGMKQKIRLGLGFLTKTPILLLDEPTSNLDQVNTEWCLFNIKKAIKNRLVIIFSNQPKEYLCCQTIINISNLSTAKNIA